MDRFIVAEITKNWNENTLIHDLIGQKFEAVININYKRGYNLSEWNLTSVIKDGTLIETIIAIFEFDEERISGVN